ncbi:MAG: intradiol ring-cleavage dioxygenase [Rubrivivax sp.]|nr:intradiol ring-cleavage dioxygenase [Rubrivivax sp.]
MAGMELAFAQQAPARATAEQVIGPFYPVRLPADQDADLTVIAGKDGKDARALGTIVYLSGRVTSLRGEPVPNAEIELWQANAAGRYTHAADVNPQPLDPHFDGYARIRTDAEGRYRFKTIKPGAYPATPTWMRPPHIHFDVRGQQSRLVTQMYFEGEELNAKDRFFDRLSPTGKEGLLARYNASPAQQEPGALVAVWNIVLMAG